MSIEKFLRIKPNAADPRSSVIRSYNATDRTLADYRTKMEGGKLLDVMHPPKEGEVIYKAVGKIVRKPAEKKAKPFEVGKIYMMNGGRIKILAISGEHLFGRAPDAGNANFWCCMFTKTGQLVGADPKFTLVPEYEEVPGGLTIEEIKE